MSASADRDRRVRAPKVVARVHENDGWSAGSRIGAARHTRNGLRSRGGLVVTRLLDRRRPLTPEHAQQLATRKGGDERDGKDGCPEHAKRCRKTRANRKAGGKRANRPIVSAVAANSRIFRTARQKILTCPTASPGSPACLRRVRRYTRGGAPARAEVGVSSPLPGHRARAVWRSCRSRGCTGRGC